MIVLKNFISETFIEMLPQFAEINPQAVICIKKNRVVITTTMPLILPKNHRDSELSRSDISVIFGVPKEWHLRNYNDDSWLVQEGLTGPEVAVGVETLMQDSEPEEIQEIEPESSGRKLKTSTIRKNYMSYLVAAGKSEVAISRRENMLTTLLEFLCGKLGVDLSKDPTISVNYLCEVDLAPLAAGRTRNAYNGIQTEFRDMWNWKEE
jgi:hypothetical protein